MDEQDREEFFRLKKIQGKKKVKQNDEEKERLANLAQGTTEIKLNVANVEVDAPTNLLSQYEQDPDIIF